MRVKIGCTIHLKKRVDDISTSAPVDLILFGIMENYPYLDVDLERSIHRYFEKRWKKGEWFTYDEEMLLDISTWPYFVPAERISYLDRTYHCPTEDEVLEIQELLKDPTTTHGSIYRKYNISRNTLLLIKKGTWTPDRSRDSRFTLPDHVVKEIYRLTRSGVHPSVAAKRFSVSTLTVWKIARGDTYRRVTSTIELENLLS